jgi:glycosyltransferase involved in cell wall biosynthesis
MNSIAGGIPVHLPLWLDYLGDPFSERQIQAAAYKNDASLLELWKLMANALLLGDRFSVASYPQKYALMGQLGIAGRLNQFNSGTEMIHVLPNCSRVMLDKPARIHSTVKGFLIPADSYVVLWAGGYNTWCDPDTLFRGLELAMKRDSMIYFVSVGGEIPGHDNVTFERFRNLTERSDLTSRFHFVGWVPNDQIPGYYRQADIAINVDLDCYEAEIGTRTRIIDWVEFSVPVVTTALCEPARIFEREGLVYTFHPGDPHSLAGALLDARKDPAKARQRAQDAKAFLDREFAEDIHFSPLLNWVRNPVFAPDRRAPNPAAQRKDAAMVADSRLAELQREFLGRFAVARPEKPRQKSISQRIVDFLVRKK